MHRRLHRVKMRLLTAQEMFRAMVRDQVAPALRDLGFKGSGQVYLLPSETHWAMLSFQKSASSDAASVRFAVNFDVTTKQEWEHRRRAFGAPARGIVLRGFPEDRSLTNHGPAAVGCSTGGTCG